MRQESSVATTLSAMLNLISGGIKRLADWWRLLIGASSGALTLATANAAHMIGKAKRLSKQTNPIAQTIREDFPSIDPTLLGEIHFERPDVALERLRELREPREQGFAPLA